MDHAARYVRNTDGTPLEIKFSNGGGIAAAAKGMQARNASGWQYVELPLPRSSAHANMACANREKKMAVVNIHGQPAPDQRDLTLLSAWFFGRPHLPSPKFWLTGIAFLALYLAFNKLAEWHQFDGLGITLWSPDNALSLLLLTEGAVFAPFVFLGAVLTDVFITGGHHDDEISD